MTEPTEKTLPTFEDYENLELKAYDQLYAKIEKNRKRIRAEFEVSGFKINCAEFHKQMKLVFPRARLWYNPDHVMTRIDEFIVDKRGVQFVEIPSGATNQQLQRMFRWPVHNGPLDGTDED